jgi:hypothetical protein
MTVVNESMTSQLQKEEAMTVVMPDFCNKSMISHL